MCSCDLTVTNLPSAFTQNDGQDLLQYFHAKEVFMKHERHKKTLFARFASVDDARNAMQRLHQACLAGRRLVLVYCDQFDREKTRQMVEESVDDGRVPAGESNGTRADSESRRAAALSSAACFPFPSPALRYSYPPPSVAVLSRIGSQLLSTPRLYTQLLHLMNKLCLPSPFDDGDPSGTTPSIPAADVAPSIPTADVAPIVPCDASTQTESGELASSPEGSEIDDSDADGSDGDEMYRKRKRTRTDKRPLRLPDCGRTKLRALLRASAIRPAPNSSVIIRPSVGDVFESSATVGEKPSLRVAPVVSLPSRTSARQTAEGEDAVVLPGFPRVGPVETTAGLEQSSERQQDSCENGGSDDFISDRQLAENRLSSKDMLSLPVCARYKPGDVTARLYLRNIGRHVESAHLRRIYGRYVDWSDPHQANMFDVRLMCEGRMKGQAFVTLPDISAAQRALRETHGYLLQDKPLVVQYARSARPKEGVS